MDEAAIPDSTATSGSAERGKLSAARHCVARTEKTLGEAAAIEANFKRLQELAAALPRLQDFVAARGQTDKPVATPLAFPNQHYNSTTSWGIDSKGEIKHVYA